MNRVVRSMMNVGKGVLWGGAGIVAALVLIPFVLGSNVAGNRVHIQYPTGHTYVKFTPGVYLKMFGTATAYPDVMTMDFDKNVSGDGKASIDQRGISVRYQDGGMGDVFGVARFSLPNDQESMKKIHKEFKSSEGVAYKLAKPVTEEIMNHTAGLMSSEESYAEKRGTFSQWARYQLVNGTFVTEEKEVKTAETGFEYCLNPELTEEQKSSCKEVKITTKTIPIISTKGGVQITASSDLKKYGIDIAGFQMVDWGYEPKTLEQIAKKREATMDIITSKANADRAKQDAITAEQTGLANVMTAKYEKEVEKARALVDAQRAAEVAVIEAQKAVAVATEQKLEAEQKKLAAVEYKQEQILRGEGDAAYKRLVMEADGALQAKLDTYERVNSYYATAIQNYAGNWVPGVLMGANDDGGAGTNGAQNLIDMLSVKTARELSLDLTMAGAK